jgi:mono/diheme cytochrome c family protein
MSARSLATVSVLTLLGVAYARGQTPAVLSANVPYGFEAGGTTLPAGTYQFKIHIKEHSLVISGAKGGDMKVPIISQLYGSSIFKDTGLVFDNFEDRHVLSEVWIGEGGVLVNATSTQHNHEMVVAVVSGTALKMSGKEVFQHTCARCHGPNGQGNPDADKFFQTQIPHLNSKFIQTKSDQELRDIITNGTGKMDPVRMGQAKLQHYLDPESVGAVIAYIRTFLDPMR